MFNYVNEVNFSSASCLYLKNVGFIYSIGSDFGFCCDKLMRILNLILLNFEFVVNALR